MKRKAPKALYPLLPLWNWILPQLDYFHWKWAQLGKKILHRFFSENITLLFFVNFAENITLMFKLFSKKYFTDLKKIQSDHVWRHLILWIHGGKSGK